MISEKLKESVNLYLDVAIKLAEIASDWHLSEIDINNDGDFVSIYDLIDKFKEFKKVFNEQS